MANEIYGKTLAATYGKLLITKSDSGFSGSSAGSERVIATDDKDGTITESCLAVGTARVGIGTTSPTGALDVETSATNVNYFVSTGANTNSGLSLQNDAQEWRLQCRGSDVDDFFRLYDITNSNKIPFQVESGTLTNTLYLKANGNVGLGTATPVANLMVERAARTTVFDAADSDTYADIIVRNPTDTINAATGIKFTVDNGIGATEGCGIAGVKVHGTAQMMDLVFITDPTGGSPVERMRIDSTGNVGIGTASPANLLHLVQSRDANYVALINQTHATGYGLYIKTQGTSADDPALAVQSNNGNKNVLICNNDGNVGIGTASPTSLLRLTEDLDALATSNFAEAESHQIVIQGGTSDGDTASIAFGTSDDNNIGAGIKGVRSTSGTKTSLQLAAGGATRIHIDGQTYNVGIGTTVPNKDLSVHSDDGGVLALNREDADNAITNGNALGKIIFGGDDPTNNTFQEGAAIYALADGTWDTDDCGANIAFYTCADGDNTLTERMRILDNGNVGIGIDAPTGYHTAGTFLHIHDAQDTTNDHCGIHITTVDSGATSGDGTFLMQAANNSFAIINKENTDMDFYTNNALRMTVDNAGNIGINTGDPSSLLELESSDGGHLQLSLYCTDGSGNDPIVRFGGANDTGASADADFDYCIGMDRSADSGAGELTVCYATGGLTTASSSIIGKWVDNGDFYTNDGTVHNLSDIRIKTDINDLTDGLNLLNQLRPRTFKYNNKTNFNRDTSRVHYGFVADEVLAVASQYVEVGEGVLESNIVDGELVETTVDDMKSLSLTKMIPMLVKAIQELSTKVTALENA
jgi:hypothetical protein